MPSPARLFIDTSYVLALYNKGDQFHERCVKAMTMAKAARQLITTDAVLLEIGNAFAAISRRSQGARIIRDFLYSPQVKVEHLTPEYFSKALELYEQRSDKAWGMVDCFSFIVMKKFRVSHSLSTDHHFLQAGFKIIP